MILSLWLYSHRYGSDILKVLVKNNKTPSKQQVIKACELDWEGEGSISPREDEWLEHDVDVDLDVVENHAGWKDYYFPVIED